MILHYKSEEQHLFDLSNRQYFYNVVSAQIKGRKPFKQLESSLDFVEQYLSGRHLISFHGQEDIVLDYLEICNDIDENSDFCGQDGYSHLMPHGNFSPLILELKSAKAIAILDSMPMRESDCLILFHYDFENDLVNPSFLAAFDQAGFTKVKPHHDLSPLVDMVSGAYSGHVFNNTSLGFCRYFSGITGSRNLDPEIYQIYCQLADFSFDADTTISELYGRRDELSTRVAVSMMDINAMLKTGQIRGDAQWMS